MVNWVEEKENLYHLIVEQQISYEELGRRYNCSGAWVKKVCLALGIPISKRRNINPNETFNKGVVFNNIANCLNCGQEYVLYYKSGRFCCQKCANEYKHKQNYQKLIDGDPSILRANYNPASFKKDILEEQGGVCAICGMPPEWNGKPLVFILDHIDGRASNNKRNNLRMICPNCDSQLDTYKSKNKNGDREYHRLNHR